MRTLLLLITLAPSLVFAQVLDPNVNNSNREIVVKDSSGRERTFEVWDSGPELLGRRMELRETTKQDYKWDFGDPYPTKLPKQDITIQEGLGQTFIEFENR